jgi:sugar phosphate isomerase/epimerase
MTTPSISVQLYSVNEALNADLDGGLSKLANIGLRYIEAFDFVRRPAELRAAFDRHGLSAPTGHAFLVSKEVRRADGTVTQVPPHEETFAAAQQLGLETVIDPFVAPERWTSVEDVQETARRLNEAAAAATAYGLTVGYHNHDHELRPRIDGRPSLEVLADHLDEEVRLEVDLYWAAAAGVDVSAFSTGWVIASPQCTSRTGLWVITSAGVRSRLAKFQRARVKCRWIRLSTLRVPLAMR